jgi:hypothetical protein
MRWLVWIAALLVAIVVAVYAIGSVLPSEHVARVERLVPHAPDEVARFIRDVRGYERWRGVKVEILSEAPGRIRYRAANGDDAISFELNEQPGGRRFTSTILDQDLPFDGSWTFDLAPEGDATRVTIEERGRVKDPLFRFLSRFVFGHTSTMETYLDALARAPT